VIWESYHKGMRREQKRLTSGQGTFVSQLYEHVEGTLQPGFGVTSGCVFALDGSHVTPCDLILYGRAHTPKLRAGVIPLIPVETTGVVIQTVDQLTKASLAEKRAHLRQVQQLPKLTPTRADREHPQTMTVLVARESVWSLDHLRELIQAERVAGAPDEQLSAIVVMNQGLILDENAHTGEPLFFPQVASRLAMRETDDVLAFLMMFVTSYLNAIELVPPNFLHLLAHMPNAAKTQAKV